MGGYRHVYFASNEFKMFLVICRDLFHRASPRDFLYQVNTPNKVTASEGILEAFQMQGSFGPITRQLSATLSPGSCRRAQLVYIGTGEHLRGQPGPIFGARRCQSVATPTLSVATVSMFRRSSTAAQSSNIDSLSWGQSFGLRIARHSTSILA